MQNRSRTVWIPLLLCVLLSAVCAPGCVQPAEPQEISATPQLTAAATPRPTAVPTPTPAPTPEPTPEPRPTSYMGSAEADVLLLDQETVRLVKSRTNQIRLYAAPSLDAPVENIKNLVTDVANSELIVLGEETAQDGTPFYYVRAAFNGAQGYMPVAQTRESVLAAEGVSGCAIMQRPGCAVYRSSKTESRLLAREDYHAVRVLGSYRGFYYVVTQEGVYGYVDPAQLRMVTREQLADYLAYGRLEDSAETFSAAAFADAAEALAGERAESAEELIVSELTRAGLYFSPGYYRYLEKPLGNQLLYPQGLYQEPVYNSLRFKLWNSAGNLVYAAGHETEWAYLGSYDEVQRGDLLFFSEYGDADTAVVLPYEVVLRGKDSGYITACGVALGDDRMLTVEDGTVTIVEHLSEQPLMRFFDSGRRILPTVTDEKAHMIETMIAAIYDRLGTPYHNIVRTGDASYDCSGIICWSLRSMGIRRDKRNDTVEMEETTAAGLSNTFVLHRGDVKIQLSRINEKAKAQEDIARLERGDLVFLLNEKRTRIGHVMLYLGDGNVIHSTTVSDDYRGTLVAGFRPELQELYSCATRIVSYGEREYPIAEQH